MCEHCLHKQQTALCALLYLLITFRNTGDGNCLYNACSIALCGGETMAVYLRCLTSIELHRNAQYSSSHPLVAQQHNKGAFSCRGNAFAMRLQNFALNSLTKDDPSKVVFAAAYNTARNHQYSSFLCMLSLSSVLQLPIESYYPIPTTEVDTQEEFSDTDIVEEVDSLALFFNCTIFPREAAGNIGERIHLFRCAVMPIGYLETTAIPEVKNHYVLFVSRKKMPPLL